ncbi:hypothetical protein [Thiomicrorhabdus sp. 6S3-12]|uniref:hypothetical protein n=1 Tax=Thiomicrorhabdus sp. 6S3-12 TaxID=2819681 RepID=UPI001AAE1531|nr:hypothetical protein [Thiomicrorhabdus sp. 6S3-12]MBO1925012.1 hypothetical protein [Thiomicrorhabdus sp. 6S3-12]
MSIEDSDIPVASGEPLLQELASIGKGLDIRHSIRHQHYFNGKLLADVFLGLHEGTYFGSDYELSYGLKLDLTESRRTDDNFSINHFSFASLNEHFDYRIGKFVSKIGTLDYLGNINPLNELQLNYYDETNINLRFAPAWMAQFNWYNNDEATTSLHFKPLNKEEYAINSGFYQYGLNVFIPFLMVNTGNDDLNLVGEKVLLPVYEDNGKAAVSKYLSENWPDTEHSFENSTVGINHLITRDNFIIGFSAFSGLAKIPLIKINPELLNDLASTDSSDKASYIEQYLQNDDNSPIVQMEFERFYQAAAYYETSWNQFGLRGELSYRDKLPLLDRVTNQATLGFGADYRNGFYTSLELQYSYYDKVDAASSVAFWLLELEPWHKDGWEFTFQNVLTAARVKENSIKADLVKLALDKKDLQIAFEYLLHDKQEYAPNSFSMRLKVKF